MAKTWKRKIFLSLLAVFSTVCIALGIWTLPAKSVNTVNAATTGTPAKYTIATWANSGDLTGVTDQGEVDDVEAYGKKARYFTLTGDVTNKGIKITFNETITLANYKHVFLRMKNYNTSSLTTCTVRIGTGEHKTGGNGVPYKDPSINSSQSYRYVYSYFTYDLKDFAESDTTVQEVYITRSSGVDSGTLEIYIDEIEFVNEDLTLDHVTSINSSSTNSAITLAGSSNQTLHGSATTTSNVAWQGWDKDIRTGKYVLAGNFGRSVTGDLTLNFNDVDMSKYSSVKIKIKNYNTDSAAPGSCTLKMYANGGSTQLYAMPGTDWAAADYTSDAVYQGWFDYELVGKVNDTLKSLTIKRESDVGGSKYGIMCFIESITFVEKQAIVEKEYDDQIWTATAFSANDDTSGVTVDGVVDDADAYNGKAYKVSLSGSVANKGIKISLNETITLANYKHVFLRMKNYNTSSPTTCTVRIGTGKYKTEGNGVPYADPILSNKVTNRYTNTYYTYDLKDFAGSDTTVKDIYITRSGTVDNSTLDMYIDEIELVTEDLAANLQHVTTVQNSTSATLAGATNKTIYATTSGNTASSAWMGWDKDLYTGEYVLAGNYAIGVTGDLTLNFDNVDMSKYSSVKIKLKNYNTDDTTAASCTLKMYANGTSTALGGDQTQKDGGGIPKVDWNTTNNATTARQTYFEYELTSMTNIPETLTSLTIKRESETGGSKYGIMLFIESITFTVGKEYDDQTWTVSAYQNKANQSAITGSVTLNALVDDSEAYNGKAYKATLTGSAADTKGIKISFNGGAGVDVSSYDHVFIRMKNYNTTSYTNCTLKMAVNEKDFGSQGYPYTDPNKSYSAANRWQHYFCYDLKELLDNETTLKSVIIARQGGAISGSIELFIDEIDFVKNSDLTLPHTNVTSVYNDQAGKTADVTTQSGMLGTYGSNTNGAIWLGWDKDLTTGKYVLAGNFAPETSGNLTLNFNEITTSAYSDIVIKMRNYNTQASADGKLFVYANGELLGEATGSGEYYEFTASSDKLPAKLTSLMFNRATTDNGNSYGIMLYVESVSFIEGNQTTVVIDGKETTVSASIANGTLVLKTPTVSGKVFLGWEYGEKVYPAGASLPVTTEGTTVTAKIATFDTPDVGSARIGTPNGLRFITMIDKTTYEWLQGSGLTYKFYSRITTLNSSKYVEIAIDPEKIYLDDDGNNYVFHSVLGEVKSQNYTRVFFADSYLEITYTDGTTTTVQALTVDGRDGRSYAQIINAYINDETVPEGSAKNTAKEIYATIQDTAITPIIAYHVSVEEYKRAIQEYFASKSFKIGGTFDINDLVESLSLNENEELNIAGEGVSGIVDDRGLNLTIALKTIGDLIANGTSEYTIVYGNDVTDYCATDLSGEMSKAMAKSYAMPYQADDGTTSKSKVISIGSTAYAKEAGIYSPADVGITMDDGFIIKSFGDNYIIYGGSNEGNLYGVYEFLRQMFGIEYLAQEGARYYPQHESVTAKSIFVLSNPDFDTRDFYASIAWGWNSETVHFGFDSPATLPDGRVTGSGANTYGNKYFTYYYGEETDSYYTGQKTTAHTSSIGHTVQELLAYSYQAAQTTPIYGDKVDVGGGNMWLKGWEQVNPSWYAKDPNYLTRIKARNNAASDINIDVDNVPNQIYTSGQAKGYAALEICWTNGLDSNFKYDATNTNSVITKLISICMDMIRDNRNAQATYLELGFADYYVECQCDNCLKAYQKFGGKSFTYSVGTTNYTTYWGGFGGTVANTVNEIAKAVKAQMVEEGINREIKFVTLGYQRAINAPVDANGNALLDLDEDVVVRMCYRACASHAINDENCPHNEQKLIDVENWHKVADEIAIWDYTVNFKDYLYYIPNLDAMKANYEYYKDIGVTQVMTQGAPGEWNFYDNVLHQYVASKLMWDTSLEVADIVADFDRMYFGSYASYASAYRATMDAMYATNDIHANTWGALDFANSNKFNAQTLKDAITELQKGIDAANDAGHTDYAKRLTSIIVTPQYMLLDMKLISGTEYNTMLASFKANVELLGMEYYAEGANNTFASKFSWK